MKFDEPPCSNGSVSLALRRLEQCQKDDHQLSRRLRDAEIIPLDTAT